jgi:hypothetical protein
MQQLFAQTRPELSRIGTHRISLGLALVPVELPTFVHYRYSGMRGWRVDTAAAFRSSTSFKDDSLLVSPREDSKRVRRRDRGIENVAGEDIVR